MDCWRISRSHRLRGACTFGATFPFGFEKEDVSFAISFSRMQPQQSAAAVPLRSRCVAALSLYESKANAAVQLPRPQPFRKYAVDLIAFSRWGKEALPAPDIFI